jgi:hypothetical protein
VKRTFLFAYRGQAVASPAERERRIISVATAPGWGALFEEVDAPFMEPRLVTLAAWALVEEGDGRTQLVGLVQEPSTDQIEYVACTSNPEAPWMVQQARNLLVDPETAASGRGFWIHDRDAEHETELMHPTRPEFANRRGARRRGRTTSARSAQSAKIRRTEVQGGSSRRISVNR